MKTLYILRHAKSDHADMGVSDHDRTLNERGKRDAPRVGERLLATGLTPDVILASTATRAKKTAYKVAKGCGFDKEVQLVAEFYLAPPAAYLSKLAGLDESISRAMVVGHNPGLEELLYATTRLARELPTAALAMVAFNIDTWPQILTARGEMIDLWLPRDE